MLAPTTPSQHTRAGPRDGSDVTDAEGKHLQPRLPAAAAHDRKRAPPTRGVVNAPFYVPRGGIAWRLLAESFPLWRPVIRRFARLRGVGGRESPNHPFPMLDRERRALAESPSPTLTDNQSTKTTKAGGMRSWDAGKKMKGRKRGAMVHTDDRALAPQAHVTRMQIRERAGRLLRAPRRRWLFAQLGYADRDCTRPRAASATSSGIEIFRKAYGQAGSAAHALRWIVERFSASINRNRRHAEDPETTAAFSKALFYTAPVMLLLRRSARR